ncbi:IclR family transcriptional regulator [Mesorhizobium waimense]|uniref:IclR family transcriptional regulator n=1 Tax=Mesorhizobium waimense TaxID=1300307 RepID=A0A3A5K136_9HYPH|nr:IclR family transcriptional regulator [Mesorhizobium waimense]RJT26111.1 IclR family transcriptional regulator [Mesorhizobium waimense]
MDEDGTSTAQDETAQSGGLINLVADTLFALTEKSEGLSIRAIAQATDNSRSSTHRILQALSRSDFVQQSESGSYVVGPRMLMLAARVFGVVPVLQIAHVIMKDLVQELGETCYLATFSEADGHATYVHRIENDHPVRYIQALGSTIPLHAGAVGKAILAALPDFDLGKLDMKVYTPNTQSSLTELKASVALARKNGYATSIEERVVGVGGAAAAVRSGDRVIGALTVSVPKNRIPPDGLDKIGLCVSKHAEALSSMLTAIGVERI